MLNFLKHKKMETVMKNLAFVFLLLFSISAFAGNFTIKKESSFETIKLSGDAADITVELCESGKCTDIIEGMELNFLLKKIEEQKTNYDRKLPLPNDNKIGLGIIGPIVGGFIGLLGTEALSSGETTPIIIAGVATLGAACGVLLGNSEDKKSRATQYADNQYLKQRVESFEQECIDIESNERTITYTESEFNIVRNFLVNLY